jgi:hypothetical protein
MNRRLWLIAAGAGAFLLFLVVRIPASAVAWIAPAELSFRSLSGTLWSGTAASITAGRVHLGETTWSLSPANLLMARLSAQVETRIGDGTATGSLARNVAGDLSCTGCSYSGPVSALWPVFPALSAVNGRLELQMPALEIRDRWLSRAVATAKLTTDIGAREKPGEPPATFQLSVNADPVPEDGKVEALIGDAGGPVNLEARLLLTPPGNFEFSGQASARPGAPPAVTSALSALGPRGADGRTQLTLTGSF